jgi:hypothetical protein
MFRRLATAVCSFPLFVSVAYAQQPGADTMGDLGFVPKSSLPPSEQIPGNRLAIAAYAFFLVLMVFYTWTVWRRIAKVEQDMQALERRQGAGKR